ncbi:hypothetical protein JHK85_045726 [Glycine max]|nr:hypothetical protein JHK85_045726 [Glycine max]
MELSTMLMMLRLIVLMTCERIIDSWLLFILSSSQSSISLGMWPLMLFICTSRDIRCFNLPILKAGFLDEALDFIHAVPQKADASIWGAVLASYRLHKDIKIAEIAARNLLRLEPYNSANYVLMMNIYSTFDR